MSDSRFWKRAEQIEPVCGAGAVAVCACSILAYGWEGEGESLSGESSGKVYVPEFLSCSLPCDSVSLICSNGTQIYAVGETREEREITQGEDTYITYEYRTGIFRISPDGGSAEELEQYRPSWEGSNEEGSLTVAGLAADGEGTLWVTEQVNRNLYELPEGFDGTADEKWEYLTGVESSYVLRKLDSQGRETERIETGNLEEKTGLDTINSVLPGQDGCIYVQGSSSLLVLDRNLEPRLTLEDEDLQGDMVLCGDGRAVTSLDQEDNRVLKLVDRPGGKWGKNTCCPPMPIPSIPGAGNSFSCMRTAILCTPGGNRARRQKSSFPGAGWTSTGQCTVLLHPGGRQDCRPEPVGGRGTGTGPADPEGTGDPGGKDRAHLCHSAAGLPGQDAHHPVQQAEREIPCGNQGLFRVEYKRVSPGGAYQAERGHPG